MNLEYNISSWISIQGGSKWGADLRTFAEVFISLYTVKNLNLNKKTENHEIFDSIQGLANSFVIRRQKTSSL